MRASFSQTGFMYSALDALELPSSPPRMKNGRPPMINCVALPCFRRCGIAACAKMLCPLTNPRISEASRRRRRKAFILERKRALPIIFNRTRSAFGFCQTHLFNLLEDKAGGKTHISFADTDG